MRDQSVHFKFGTRSEPTHFGCCDHDENLWLLREEDLIPFQQRALLGTTLVKDASLILNGKVLRLPPCYPVYRRGYLWSVNVDHDTCQEGCRITGTGLVSP